MLQAKRDEILRNGGRARHLAVSRIAKLLIHNVRKAVLRGRLWGMDDYRLPIEKLLRERRRREVR
jgi:hypothetical protein